MSFYTAKYCNALYYITNTNSSCITFCISDGSFTLTILIIKGYDSKQ